MKAITLTQPWATLVAIGAKKIETRSWSTRYHGPIAIHAAKTFPGSAKATAESAPFLRALGWPEPTEGHLQEWMDDIAGKMKQLPLGKVLAVGTVVNCIPSEQIGPYLTPQERAFGDYSPGRFGFLLSNVTPLLYPVPAKGALGLWNWDEYEASK